MDQQLRNFVLQRFAEAHDATPAVDYPQWNRIDGKGAAPAATLGYREAGHGPLFLENYLEAPIERLVSEAMGRAVDRQAIVEIGCLAAVPSLALVRLWCHTADDLSATHEVAVATLTRSLRAMFARIGMPLVQLVPADPAMIDEPGSWGRYYQLDPIVCAGDIRAGARALTAFHQGGRS